MGKTPLMLIVDFTKENLIADFTKANVIALIAHTITLRGM